MQAAAASAVEITTEQRGGDVFFTVNLAVSQQAAPRPLPRQVQIVWDASASAAGRQLDRELALLDAYFKRAGTIAVSLVRIADTAFANERFVVKNGDWSALRRALQATVYDGASNLGAVRHDGVSKRQSGLPTALQTMARVAATFPVPAYMVMSSAIADRRQHALADQAADAASYDDDDASAAADALLERGTQLVEVAELGAKDVVVASRHATAGRLVLAGVLTAASAELTLRLRGSDGAMTTRKVRIESGHNASRLAGVQWARLTLASLEGDASVNKVRIREIGRRFGLATRETSLLVLELVDDYVRNEIEPPPPLRAAYERMRRRRERIGAERRRAAAQVVRRFEARVAVVGQGFPKVSSPKFCRSPSSRRARWCEMQQSRQRRNEASADSAVPLPMASAPAPARLAAQPAEREQKEGRRDATAPSISIALKPAAANSAGSSACTQRSRRVACGLPRRERVTMNERRFFLDSGGSFCQKNQRELGCARYRTWRKWICRTAKCCVYSLIGCSRRARSILRCQSSSACLSWRRTSRSRIAILAWRWRSRVSRSAPLIGCMRWSPVHGIHDSPTST